MKRTCAICTALVDQGAEEPLGRNNAMVFVCLGCATERPKVRQGPERGYEPSGGLLDSRTVTAGMRRATHAVGRPRGQRVMTPNAVSLAPGYLLIRIRMRPKMDAHAAYLTLAHEPWFPHVRALGTAKGWFLFERPDPEARVKREIVSPLEAIERYRHPGDDHSLVPRTRRAQLRPDGVRNTTAQKRAKRSF